MWNEVEAAEKRRDAQVAREIRVAIPRELRPEDGRALVRDYAQRSFVDRGMVADIAVHGGQEGHNPHAHIMLTTRTITPEGFGPKNREWNKKEHVTTWRKDWADSANRALAQHGRPERIDAREQERAALRDELRTIQQQIQQVQALIRRGLEKVKETVKGLVRGPQPDRADTPAAPPTAERPTSAPKPQQGGDRGTDDDWMPGQGFLGRG